MTRAPWRKGWREEDKPREKDRRNEGESVYYWGCGPRGGTKRRRIEAPSLAGRLDTECFCREKEALRPGRHDLGDIHGRGQQSRRRRKPVFETEQADMESQDAFLISGAFYQEENYRLLGETYFAHPVEVDLIRHPENPLDSCTIEVRANGFLLGDMPLDLARKYAPKMDAGATAQAWASIETEKGVPPKRAEFQIPRLKITFTLTDDPETAHVVAAPAKKVFAPWPHVPDASRTRSLAKWFFAMCAAVGLGVACAMATPLLSQEPWWPFRPAHVATAVDAAWDLLLARASAGDAKSQMELADKFMAGHVVPKDESSALFWYEKAARQGDARAQYLAGWCYVKGVGTPVNVAAGKRWMEMSAEKGNADAQFALGLIGLAEGENPAGSRKLVEQASASGNANARQWLAENPEYGTKKKKIVKPASKKPLAKREGGEGGDPESRENRMAAPLPDPTETRGVANPSPSAALVDPEEPEGRFARQGVSDRANQFDRVVEAPAGRSVERASESAGGNGQ